jgi:hypothetical protein
MPSVGPESPGSGDLSPEPVVQLAISFMAAKHLFAAVDIGLFAALADGPVNLDVLTQRVGIPRRTTRISADAMVALGLVERHGDRYANAAVADVFLSGKTPADLRPFVRLMSMRYGGWENFEAALRAGSGSGFITHLKPDEQQIFSDGVEAVTAGSAHALVERYDFAQHKALLDVGGGTGSFLLPVLGRYPDLDCALLELPSVAAIARHRLAQLSLADRVRVFEADLLSDPIPDGFDLFLLANVVHVFSPEQNQDILSRIGRHAAAGTRLLLVDFWTGPTHTEPVFAAVMAGEFLLAGGEGDVYSEDDVHDWLGATGWELLERRPLAGPASLIVAQRTSRA